jgi:hypothetical protein
MGLIIAPINIINVCTLQIAMNLHTNKQVLHSFITQTVTTPNSGNDNIFSIFTILYFI